MVYDAKWLVGVLGTPATMGLIVAWVVEYVEDFHALSPLGKKLVFILGCPLVAFGVAGVGVWLGYLEPTRVMWVNTFLAACTAFWTSQAAHVPHAGRR